VIDLPVGFRFDGSAVCLVVGIRQRRRLRRACKVVAPSKGPILPTLGFVAERQSGRQELAQCPDCWYVELIVRLIGRAHR
jgi:hypothetical protein